MRIANLDVEELETHGGSLRVYGCHEEYREPLPSTDSILSKEKSCSLRKIETYKNFQPKVKRFERFINFPHRAKRKRQEGSSLWCSCKRKYLTKLQV